MTALRAELVSALEKGVWGCLREIHDPCSLATGVPLTLEEMGLVSSVEVGADGDVHVHLRLTSPSCMMVGLFVPQIEDRVHLLPGVRSVEVTHDTGMEWSPELMREDVRRRRAEALARQYGSPALTRRA